MADQTGRTDIPKRLISLIFLLRDPAGWSAERYRRQQRLSFTALYPDRWPR